MCCPPRSMRASALAIGTALPTSCSRRCATNSAAMSRSRRPSDMTDHVQPAPACVLVIFGAGGDLTKRLLVPALYNLCREKLLPEDFSIIGIARADQNDETFRQGFDTSMQEFASRSQSSADWKWLRERMFYLKGDFEDADTYRLLGERLAKNASDGGQGGNVLFYLATPPSVFAPV